MSLEEWDRDIAPHISGIRLDAGWIGHYARKIEERLGHLRVKPDWPTEAESVLSEAIAELEHSLLVLKGAHQCFARLPVSKL